MKCENYKHCKNYVTDDYDYCQECRERIWNGEFLECEPKSIQMDYEGKEQEK